MVLRSSSAEPCSEVPTTRSRQLGSFQAGGEAKVHLLRDVDCEGICPGEERRSLALEPSADVDGRHVMLAVAESLGMLVDLVSRGRQGQGLFQLIREAQCKTEVLLHVLKSQLRREGGSNDL